MALKKNRNWWVRMISIVVLIASWIVFIIVRLASKNVDIKTALYITIGFTFVSVLGLFSEKIKSSFEKKEEEKLLTKEDITNMILKYAHNERKNNLRIERPIEKFKERNINGDVIYALRIFLNLDDESFIYIINASKPNRDATILKSDASDEEIEEEMNNKASIPKDSPLVKEVVSENPLTGMRIVSKETMPVKKDDKEVDTL